MFAAPENLLEHPTATFHTLWNMADNSLLWSVDTDSYMQGSADKEAANLASFLHEALKDDGLVAQ